MDTPPEKNVYERMLEIYTTIATIQKTGTNQDQNYQFIEQAAIAAHIRQLFVQQKLVMITEVESVERTDVPRKDKAPAQRVMMKFKFTILCADKPENKIEWTGWPGEAFDFSDKAINKAGTAAQKYFLIRQFFISDIDPDSITAMDDATKGRGKTGGAKAKTEGDRPLAGAWREFMVKLPQSKTLRKGKKLGDLQDAQLQELDRWLAKQPAEDYKPLRANLALAMAEKDIKPTISPIETLKAEMAQRKITEAEFLKAATKGEWVHDTCDSFGVVQEADARKILLSLDKFMDELEKPSDGKK